jgi:hypothetical protein
MTFVAFCKRCALLLHGSISPETGGIPRQRATRRSFVGWCVVAMLLLFAAAHLAWRGPLSVRGHWNLCDFASPWASARLWLTGQNPYDNARLWDTWITSHGAFETDHDLWLALNAPGAYAALAPLAALPAGLAGGAWLGLCVAAVVVILGCALSLARVRLRSLTAWLVIAAALASAPVQTILAVGQLSLPVIGLCFVAMCLARDGRDGWAGVLLGIAVAVKPQLVAPLLAYYALGRRWRLVLPAALVACAVTLVAIVPMQWRGIPWQADWARNLALATTPGGANDPTSSGPWRNQIIDLRAWLFALTDRRDVVVPAGAAISVLLAGLYVALVAAARAARAAPAAPAVARGGEPRDELLPLAALMALTLLPVYHKVYDATVLVLPLAWAVRSLRDARQRGVAVVTLASLTVFLIPFDLLPLIMQRTRALDGLAQTWAWRAVIYPHHALASLATAVCALYALWRAARVPRPQLACEADKQLDGELEPLASA